MNTALRVLDQDRFQASLPSLRFKRPRLINTVLIVALLLSAFSVIYIKDINRRLFIQYQSLQVMHDKFYEEWGKLLLEQSTWSTQSRVEKIAQRRLDMGMPSTKEIVVLRLHKS